MTIDPDEFTIGAAFDAMLLAEALYARLLEAAGEGRPIPPDAIQQARDAVTTVTASYMKTLDTWLDSIRERDAMLCQYVALATAPAAGVA